MVDIHDYDIQCIEHEILWKYDKSPCDYPDCDCLLSLRKDMINERVLAHQEEILPDIIAFNDAMTAALRELYDRTHRIWDSIKDNEDFKDAEIEAKCYLGYDYPKLHPVQGDDRQDLWYAICDAGWNKLYDDGVSLRSLSTEWIMIIRIGMKDLIESSLRICTLQVPSTTSMNIWSLQLRTSFMCVSLRPKSILKSIKAYDMKNIRTNRFVKELLNSTNNIVNIDINDVKDLFQESEFDVSVPADKENRMQQLMEQIKKYSKCHEPYNCALVFFFFPEKRPLLMEEMKPLSEWIESVPGEFMIKWGMAIHPTSNIRAIVALSYGV